MDRIFCLGTIFLALFSQMLFLGEQNVIYANILSLPVLPAFLISIYNNRGKIFFNDHSKVLSLLLIYFLLSYFWSDFYVDPNLTDYKPFLLTIFFVICISNIMSIYGSIMPVMLAFWGITLFNLFILLGLIPQELFFNLEYWQIRFWGTFNNPNVGAITFTFSLFFADQYLKEKVLNINLLKKIILISIMLFSILLVIATASKKGVLLILIYFLNKIFNLNFRKKSSKNILWVVLIITFFIQFINVDILTSSLDETARRVYKFVVSYNSDVAIGGSTSERLFFIKEGLNGFLDSPILGHGFKSFESKYGFYSHNNYIEMLYNGGVIAFVIYLSIYFSLFLKIKRQNKSVRVLIVFSILSLMAIDIAAVTYSIKIIQYYICTLFVLIQLRRKKQSC